MIIQAKESGSFDPHPGGIWPAVCVDIIDLGMVDVDFQGKISRVQKLRFVFETEAKTQGGDAMTVFKNFTASLHPKSKLAPFLASWRGRPVVIGESIELNKCIGTGCTLVTSLQQTNQGKVYASIDAISRPTKKIAASGNYDPAGVRNRMNEYRFKNGMPSLPDTNSTPPPPANTTTGLAQRVARGLGQTAQQPYQGQYAASAQQPTAPAQQRPPTPPVAPAPIIVSAPIKSPEPDTSDPLEGPSEAFTNYDPAVGF